MGVVIIDTLQRGGSGVSPFPVIQEADSKLSYITVADLTARDAIPEWQRLPFMRVYVVATATDYRLGSDVTIGGQIWSIVNAGISPGTYQLVSEKNQPSGYVGLEANGKINPTYIQNIYSNNSFVVADQTARNNTSTQTGDIIITTGDSKIWVKLNNNPPVNVPGDYAELTFPGSVLSVNGQTGVVSITVSNLLAVPANLTDFNNAVAAAPSVTGLNGSVVTNTINIATNSANIASLQASVGLSLIPTYNPANTYQLNTAVKVLEVSGRYNLYVANTSVPLSTPPPAAEWDRIGDYFTTTEVSNLLLTKADLVAGVVPLSQTPSEALVMSYIVNNLAGRNAITPQIQGMRVYVTGNSSKYIYSPGHGLADPQGFVVEQTSGSTTFIGLSDVPASYTGFSGQTVRVNVTETGLEFAPAGATGHVIQNTGISLINRTNLNFLNGFTAVDDGGSDTTLVKLGGSLTESTTINTSSNNFVINQVNGAANSNFTSTHSISSISITANQTSLGRSASLSIRGASGVNIQYSESGINAFPSLVLDTSGADLSYLDTNTFDRSSILMSGTGMVITAPVALRLNILGSLGTNGQVLTSNGTTATWQNSAGGGGGGTWGSITGTISAQTDLEAYVWKTAGTSTLTGNVIIDGAFNITIGTSTVTQTYSIGTGINASGQTKTINIGTGGAAGSTTNINMGSNLGGSTTIGSGTILGTSATQNLFNTVALTMNFVGAATTLTMGGVATTAINVQLFNNVTSSGQTKSFFIGTSGAAGSTTNVTIGSATASAVLGTLSLNFPTILTAVNNTTVNLWNTLTTTINFAGAATALNIGSSSGTLTLGNPIVVGAVPSQQLYNSVATTLSIGGATTTFNLNNVVTATMSVNMATGATTSGQTKTLNIGTAGVSGSTTNINIGSVVAGALGTTTFGQVAVFTTATTAKASIRIPHGVSPTTPVNGDIWTTTDNLFVRLNGATNSFIKTGGVTLLTNDTYVTTLSGGTDRQFNIDFSTLAGAINSVSVNPSANSGEGEFRVDLINSLFSEFGTFGLSVSQATLLATNITLLSSFGGFQSFSNNLDSSHPFWQKKGVKMGSSTPSLAVYDDGTTKVVSINEAFSALSYTNIWAWGGADENAVTTITTRGTNSPNGIKVALNVNHTGYSTNYTNTNPGGNGVGVAFKMSVLDSALIERSARLQHVLTNATTGTVDSDFRILGFSGGASGDFLRIEGGTQKRLIAYGPVLTGTLSANPTSPTNGELYYNSTANELRARINSTWVALGAGGGSSLANTTTNLTARTDFGKAGEGRLRVDIGSPSLVEGDIYFYDGDLTFATNVSTLGLTDGGDNSRAIQGYVQDTTGGGVAKYVNFYLYTPSTTAAQALLQTNYNSNAVEASIDISSQATGATTQILTGLTGNHDARIVAIAEPGNRSIDLSIRTSNVVTASINLHTTNGITVVGKTTFTPTATVAGLNVGGFTANPSSPANGDLYYNSSANELRARINGTWTALGAGGGGWSTTGDTTLTGTGVQQVTIRTGVGDSFNISTSNTNDNSSSSLGVVQGTLAAANSPGYSYIGGFEGTTTNFAFLYFDLQGQGGIGSGVIMQDGRATKRGIQYAADYSADFDNRSLADWGNVWRAKGTTTLSAAAIIAGAFDITIGNDTGARTYNFGTGATLNATTKIINIGTGGVGGSITQINFGSTAGGLMTINNPTIVSGTSGLTLFNTVAVTISAFGAASTLTMGAATGTATINNATITFANATTLNGGAASVNLFNTTATTINFGGAATTMAIGGTPTAGTIVFNAFVQAMASGQTKTLNLGTNGAAGSTATINIATGSSGPSNINVGSVSGTATFIPRTVFRASTATSLGTSINIPHGATPSTFTDGDLWTTTSGLSARINGATVTFGAGGGNVSNTGTPVNQQLAVWTNATTIQGLSSLTWSGTALGTDQTVVSIFNSATQITIGSTSSSVIIGGTSSSTISLGLLAGNVTINLGFLASGSANVLIGASSGGTTQIYSPFIQLEEIPVTSSTFSTDNMLVRVAGTQRLQKIAASGGGTTNFLRADGTWAAPGGGSGWSTSGATTITGNTSQSGAFTNTFTMDGIFIAQNAKTTGTPTAFTVTPGTHTGLTAQTPDIYFNLGGAKQFVAGGTVIQHAIWVTAPSSYSFTTGSTMSIASTLHIAGAPSSGTNNTITNTYGVYLTGYALTGTVTNSTTFYASAHSGATLNFSAHFTAGVGVRIGPSTAEPTALPVTTGAYIFAPTSGNTRIGFSHSIQLGATGYGDGSATYREIIALSNSTNTHIRLVASANGGIFGNNYFNAVNTSLGNETFMTAGGSPGVGVTKTIANSYQTLFSAAHGISGSTSGNDVALTGGTGFSSGSTNGGHAFIRGGNKFGGGLDGNIGLNTLSVAGWGSMERGMFLADATTAASGNPTSGIFLWASGAADSTINYRKPSSDTGVLMGGAGTRKITVGTVAPTGPVTGDLWVDTN